MKAFNMVRMRTKKKKQSSVFVRDIEVLKENPYEKYIFVKALGDGSSGEVNLYSLRQDYVAMKEFKNNRKGEKEFNEELNAFRMISDHKHVVRLLAAFRTYMGPTIVLEYCQQGDLSGIWHDVHRYDESMVREILLQVISGLKFMYDMKVAHRDIKPDNILVQSWDPVHVLVGDLNYAKSFDGGDLARTTVFTTKLGTRDYRAPEILSDSLRTHLANNKLGYNHKCDIWSLGVVFYQLLSSNRKPYQPTLEEILSLRERFGNEIDLQFQAAELEFRRVKDDEIGFSPMGQWNKVSAEARDLVRKMLANVPASRIDYNGILEHKWTETDLEGRGDIFNINTYKREYKTRLDALFDAFRIDTAAAKAWMFKHSYYA